MSDTATSLTTAALLAKRYQSCFKGVTLNETRTAYVAAITVDGKVRRLGEYLSEVDAARAYDRAAVAHFGAFARLNFPESTTKGK